MSTWIKLHRKVLDNEIFRNDRTAWHVFETLLVIADKSTGKWSGGMFQLSNLSGVQKPTLYSALQRLEKAKMITRLSNTHYTVYSICKWSEYQSGVQTDIKQTSNKDETIVNTLTRIKNKELRTITNVIEPKAQFGNSDVNTVIEKFETTYKLKLSKVKQNRNAASNLIRKHGLDQTLKAIEAASMCLQDQYAPSIVNLMDLQEKYDKLRVYYARQTKQMEMINADN